MSEIMQLHDCGKILPWAYSNHKRVTWLIHAHDQTINGLGKHEVLGKRRLGY